MLKLFKKLTYGARVYLAQSGGEPETIDVRGRSTVIMHGGKGPAFVYLHSSLGEAVRWLPFFQTWSRDYTVYVPVHPGFGKSGGFEQIDNIEDMAYHYLELFEALGLEEIILGGVSLGGWIAAEFAVRWPERVSKLWLSAAPGLWVDETPLPDLFRYMENRPESRRKMRELLFHAPDGHMAEMIMGGEPTEERIVTSYQSMTVLARMVWERPYDPKLAARLYRVQCPTLLLWGANDRLVPPAYGEAYQKHLPQAELQLIPECGHLAMFEKEHAFAEAIARFCKS